MSVSTGSSNRNIFASFRFVKPPTLGELREPLSFYRSTRRPKVMSDGSNTVDFTQDVDSYANVWGKMHQSQVTMQEGQASENFCSHAFVVRNDLPRHPELRDYIVWKGQTLRVKGTKVLEGQRSSWLLVVCELVGTFAEDERVVYDSIPEDDAREPSPYDPGNPLWR